MILTIEQPERGGERRHFGSETATLAEAADALRDWLTTESDRRSPAAFHYYDDSNHASGVARLTHLHGKWVLCEAPAGHDFEVETFGEAVEGFVRAIAATAWWNECQDAALAALAADWRPYTELRQAGHSFAVYQDIVSAGLADHRLIHLYRTTAAGVDLAAGGRSYFRRGTGHTETVREEITS